MAYDEALAARIRAMVAGRPNVAEIKMFGGLCFTVGGNMFAGIVGDELMARLPKQDHDAALARPGARPMDFTGRPMVGYVYVNEAGVKADADLSSWVEQCYVFAASLPPKVAGARKTVGSRKRKSA